MPGQSRLNLVFPSQYTHPKLRSSPITNLHTSIASKISNKNEESLLTSSRPLKNDILLLIDHTFSILIKGKYMSGLYEVIMEIKIEELS